MLKKSALRRITTATLAFIIVSIIYFFPKDSNSHQLEEEVNYLDVPTSPIYLLNKDDYLVRTTVPIAAVDILEKIKEQISILTIDNEHSENIPPKLKPIIPKNTKLKNISLENGLLKINFSKELLNCPLEDEEKIIETLVYTLTENKEVQEIMIFIDDNKLDYLPQSKIFLPNTLTRDYGINKVYDITNVNNLSKTTVYYIGKENDFKYYIPITKISNNEQNKVEIILEELKSSPIYETNLLSYLASSVELLNYEILEDSINLSFNNEIFSDLDEKNILEEVKYSIAYSLKDSLHVKEVNFLVDGETINVYKE